MIVRLAVAAFASAALATNADAQTIPQLARSKPANPVVRGRLLEVFPTTLDQLMAGADWVVDARITKLKSYLTPNEEHILTDYEVVPYRVFVATGADLPRAPQRPKPVILTMYGGDMTIDGITVSEIDYGLKRLKDKGRYLLFLVRWRTQGASQLYEGAAFELDGEHVKAIVPTDEELLFKDIRGHVFSDVADRIAKIAAQKKAVGTSPQSFVRRYVTRLAAPQSADSREA
jgi:hypothetical protein